MHEPQETFRRRRTRPDDSTDRTTSPIADRRPALAARAFSVEALLVAGIIAAAALGAGCSRSPLRPTSSESLLNSGLPTTSDCVGYITAALRIEQEPDQWLLTDGLQRMFTLATAEDAARALALARRYGTLCFIGRDNTRPDRRAYILHYWQNGSGFATTLPPDDCDAYAPSNLRTESAGAAGWAVMDGDRRVALLASESDARRALAVAVQSSARCYIGRHNSRPEPLRYTVDYWQ